MSLTSRTWVATPALVALGIAISAMSANAQDNGSTQCRGQELRIGDARVETTVSGRRLEVRVTGDRGVPIRAQGSVTLVVGGEAQRLKLFSMEAGTLTTRAPADLTYGSAVIHLTFADGSKGATRFSFRALQPSTSCARPGG
ncbi:MAG: hypothetical protein IV086_13240 [Hyphomonadaceae bacterium]|nr:hypothetical protein [Hyphomonadaceae bacterium]